MSKTYRNIFFWTKIIQVGKGSQDIYYTGRMYDNAKNMKDFKKLFDYSQDLCVICDTCAAKKYRSFIKVKKES